MSLRKDYLYKISRHGVFLGVLPSPKNDFGYNQNINNPGSQILIELAHSPDETAPIFGDGGLIEEDNSVEVVMTSDIYPNGKTVFLGYMSKWTANFGGNETIQITCLSYGSEFDNYMIESGEALDFSQPTLGDSIGFGGFSASINNRVAQTFKPGSSENIRRMSFGLRNLIGVDLTVKLTIYLGSSPEMGTPLASTSKTFSHTYSDYEDFVFSSPIRVVNTNTYSCVLEGGPDTDLYSGNVFEVSSSTTDVYPDGSAWLFTGGHTGSWGSISEDLGFFIYKTTGNTTAPYVATDPAAILKSIIDDYSARGGHINYGVGTIDSTGLPVDYTFKVNTLLEGVQKITQLSPQDFYWYVDIGTNTLYFKQESTTADHIMIKGRHINELDLTRTSENIKNVVYFSGGDVGGGINLFEKYTNPTSLLNNPPGLGRISDNRVTDEPTASLLAHDDLDRNANPIYQTQLKIPDGVYDIDSFKLGQMIALANFGNFIDTLLLQIVGINYSPDIIILTLGSLIPRSQQTVSDLRRQLDKLQTIGNPTAPS